MIVKRCKKQKDVKFDATAKLGYHCNKVFKKSFFKQKICMTPFFEGSKLLYKIRPLNEFSVLKSRSKNYRGFRLIAINENKNYGY